VATLAKSMGVRESKLEEVPSLALGTSPVTLKEMVSAYSTIANDGRYIEPVLFTQVEDRNGAVLEVFKPRKAETAMSVSVAQTLLDAMRGVIDRGTGTGIRYRFGIQADVAGKTGTTQDNTDGWFILMHPQLVAGAWVGFNDNRVTMGDRWGQGAQSALPMIGEFFQHALNARVIDPRIRFDAPQSQPAGNSGGAGATDPMLDQENGLSNGGALPGTDQQPDNIPMEESGTAPQEGLQPAPAVRYLSVPPPAPGAPRPEQDMQAAPRPFEALPTEGRRARRAERPGQSMEGAPEYLASEYRAPPAPR
jgi:penicillin-binding protein 1A